MRSGDDGAGYTMVSPDWPFICNGQVTEWRYHRRTVYAFQAVVWRPVNGSATKFQIVGINDIPTGSVNTIVTYIVPENQRITVKVGDVIGWSFDNHVLSKDSGGNYHVRWLGDLHGSLQVNQVHDFYSGETNGGANREYSITATVG